jgi:hypothetical protein
MYDAFGNLELISRDPNIGSVSPIPVKPRAKPPVIASGVDWAQTEGDFMLLNVNEGLPAAMQGSVKRLRIVGCPPKTQPLMNTPNLGVTSDDPGKYVIGTVPVAADGSAHFRVPAGASVFFQALDSEGYAIQTMRTLTCVQPGETLSCVGCHEPRTSGPRNQRPQASRGVASKITVGPEGSWPLRYDKLVQPVLDRQCVQCHQPAGQDKRAAAFDLTADRSYAALLNWGKPSLAEHVRQRYAEGRSLAGASAARQSPLLTMLRAEKGHYGVRLEGDDLMRLVTWMDVYGQRLGSFSPDQEERLKKLRVDIADLLQ